MSALNICIDIDGTITDPFYWLDLANKHFNKNINTEQVTEYYVHDVMGVDRHEYEALYEENKFRIHSNERLSENVKPVLDLLSVIHNIYFVTARDKELELLTRKFLKENRIPFDGLYVLGSSYKVDKAKELMCDVFIEDSYENALQLASNGIKVLLVDTNYNRKPLYENMTRVRSWREIFTMLCELGFQKQKDVTIINS